MHYGGGLIDVIRELYRVIIITERTPINVPDDEEATSVVAGRGKQKKNK